MRRFFPACGVGISPVATGPTHFYIREMTEPTTERRTFAVVLEPEDEGGFTVRVPALPEIVTYGKDEGEALAMAEDAIRLVIEDSVARRGGPLSASS
jgi:antitoxin HicB